MAVTKVSSAEQYSKLLSSSSVTVALFSAEWADQCKQILSVMSELAKQATFGGMQFLDVPAEELSEVSLKHQIDAVPTVIFFKAGTAVDRIDGVDIAALTTKCRKYAGTPEASSDGSFENRLKALINRANVMIFMKGDRDAPRCGFSKQLIAIMNETGVAYDTFDILTDEEVRQGLKTYSDWPTYPQVYVKGELIGGLDIIKELLTAGELNATLSA
ncbi:glutaredoxin 3 [Toxorhynchites rutilus septentrionalis]|uniref:glutaredoxin 3 n=1 Tax=Toxorhynchites rutilus septentrionalis TaxID=329112 RepID=UPI0024794B93|nr:glutaredoxin 3 [Toxorhynchites rutilus septentrionalis]